MTIESPNSPLQVLQKSFYDPNLQFVKKIKRMLYLVIHDNIILTRHCQSFLVHKDDDSVKKLWRPISNIIIRRAQIGFLCALCSYFKNLLYIS